MDPQLQSLLDDLHAWGEEHDAAREDRLGRMRNLEPDTAALLAVLARATQPARMLELGTSNGYSTIWLADAARSVGASLTSVDIDPERTAGALENLRRAGLDAHVTLLTEDAASTLASSPDATWGLILLDAERPAYASYWKDLVRSLEPGGLLVVDNVLSHADEVVAFRALIAAAPEVIEALVPLGAGALLVVKAGTRTSRW
jgi:predicted O-methyltransferase YrrM